MKHLLLFLFLFDWGLTLKGEGPEGTKWKPEDANRSSFLVSDIQVRIPWFKGTVYSVYFFWRSKHTYLTNLKMVSDHLEQDPVLSYWWLEFYPLRDTSFLDSGEVFVNTITSTWDYIFIIDASYNIIHIPQRRFMNHYSYRGNQCTLQRLTYHCVLIAVRLSELDAIKYPSSSGQKTPSW